MQLDPSLLGRRPGMHMERYDSDSFNLWIPLTLKMRLAYPLIIVQLRSFQIESCGNLPQQLHGVDSVRRLQQWR